MNTMKNIYFTLLGVALCSVSAAQTSAPVEPSTAEQNSASSATLIEPYSEALQRSASILDNRSALQLQNKQLVSQNQLLQQELDVLTANYSALQESRNNQFFLFGGLLLALGACLSALLPRLRGRKRFSEWG